MRRSSCERVTIVRLSLMTGLLVTNGYGEYCLLCDPFALLSSTNPCRVVT
jgi:hypothetical protein